MTPTEFTTARKQLGLTRVELACALGLSKDHGFTTIGRYERGEHEIPRVVVLAMKWLEHQNGRSLTDSSQT